MHGQGLGVTVAHYHHAVLCNGLAQYEEAATAAQAAPRHQEEFGAPRWALGRAGRGGRPQRRARAGGRRARAALGDDAASGTDWALGVEARSRALLSEGDAAEQLYREAIERLGRTRVRVELARAHSCTASGCAARTAASTRATQLGMAHEMLDPVRGRGVRRTRAPRAAGHGGQGSQTDRSRRARPSPPQEAQIARLAGDGLTNPEIGAQHVPQPPHGRVAPSQGVLEARHLIPSGDSRGTAARRALRLEAAWTTSEVTSGSSRSLLPAWRCWRPAPVKPGDSRPSPRLDRRSVTWIDRVATRGVTSSPAVTDQQRPDLEHYSTSLPSAETSCISAAISAGIGENGFAGHADRRTPDEVDLQVGIEMRVVRAVVTSPGLAPLQRAFQRGAGCQDRRT